MTKETFHKKWYYRVNESRIIFSILAILLGVFMFVYAGIDDSSGGQLPGFIVAVIGIVGVIKSKRLN